MIMRLGFLYPDNAYTNSQYRALMPMNMLRDRGHEIVWWGQSSGDMLVTKLAGCDLVHVYRAATPPLLNSLTKLRRDGVAITWDNDDDVTALSEHARREKGMAGLAVQRDFAAQIRAIRLAHTVTTTSPTLAVRFRDAGAKHVQVVENYLPPEFTHGQRASHSGLTIGWVAALEHQADIKPLNLKAVLRDVLKAHSHIRVVTVGLDLQLEHERYERREPVLFENLAALIRGFDIAIAPLADLPFNHARSNVKLKEYAIAGIPWLASPVGPYAAMGPREGGRLVPDGEWYNALDRLIRRRRERAILGLRAKLWGRSQTINLHVHRWEQVFQDAIGRAGTIV